MGGDARVGEWLARPVKGRALRLVVERMSEGTEAPAIGAAALEAVPAGRLREQRSADGRTLAWSCDREVEFRSLRVAQGGGGPWIRGYRLEVSADGIRWDVATPSRLLDACHRQPFRVAYALEEFATSRLEGAGALARRFHEDYLLRSVETLGEGSAYPRWMTAPFFIACGARPYFFSGFYAPGDCPVFNSLIASILAPELARETERVYGDIIRHLGFLTGVSPAGEDGKEVVQEHLSGINWPPSTFRDVFAWSRDRDALPEFAEACERWARWILANRDRDGDGWLEPGVNAWEPSPPEFRQRGAREHPEIACRAPEYWDYRCPRFPEQSAFQAAIFELATDDYPVYVSGRHRGVRFDAKTGSLDVHYIDTQLYLAILAGFLDHAYRALGREAEAVPWAAEASRMTSLVAANCWDPDTLFYHDVDHATGARRTFAKHVAGFYPLMLGIPTVNQAELMVAHLTNPREFWTEYPVPSLSLDSPDFIPSGYWSGRSWPPFNFIVLRGLLNYGFFDVADELLARWTSQTRSCLERPAAQAERIALEGKVIYDARRTRFADVDLIVPENWNSRTGEVHGSGGTTWGGLWIPALIMRNFWPVGEDGCLLRGGGCLRLRQGGRWDVEVDSHRAMVNGRGYRLERNTTYLVDGASGDIRALPQGRADSTCL